MGKITNTEKNEIRPEWLMGGNPGAIETQEKRGQQEWVNSTYLPTEIVGKEILEKSGVKFGNPIPSDPIFCEAELPQGWEKKGTDHPMWSELVDSDGNVRASIFYKAAFYDRSAFMIANENIT